MPKINRLINCWLLNKVFKKSFSAICIFKLKPNSNNEIQKEIKNEIKFCAEKLLNTLYCLLIDFYSEVAKVLCKAGYAKRKIIL